MTRNATARVVGIIQARMGSTRLGGKTLADVEGRPLLAWILDRIRASRMIDDVVVATTTAAEDEAIVRLATAAGVGTYRGSADDVLDRYYQAALLAKADVVVRLTADDPFKDPDVIDIVANTVISRNDLDYASNTIEPTYPEGLDVEAFTFDALSRAWRDARLASEREHVTPYIWKNPTVFRVENVRCDRDLSHLRWTLDYEEDLRFTREIYARLATTGLFRMQDILDLLDREPVLATINTGIERNAGYALSVAKDATAS